MRTIIFFLFTLLVIKGFSNNNEIEIPGKIFDSENNTPIFGARVTISDSINNFYRIFVSDINGYFKAYIPSYLKSFQVHVYKEREPCGNDYLPYSRSNYSLPIDTIKIGIVHIDVSFQATSMIFNTSSFVYYIGPDSTDKKNLFALNNDQSQISYIVQCLTCDNRYHLHIESYYSSQEGNVRKDDFAIFRAEYLSSYFISQGIDINRIIVSIEPAIKNKYLDTYGGTQKNLSIIILKLELGQ